MARSSYVVYAWSKASEFDADPIDFASKDEAIAQAVRDVTFSGPLRRNQLRADGAIVERLGGKKDALLFAIWRDDNDKVQQSTVASVIRAVELVGQKHQAKARQR